MSQNNASIDVGCWVKIAGFEPDEEETYRIVEDSAARPTEYKLGESSALAQALLGKTPGDRVPFHTRTGEVKLTVVDVGRN